MKTVTTAVALAAALLSASTAYANSVDGHAALSLAELVGLRSPLLPAAQKDILFKFMAGNTSFRSSDAPFAVTATEIDCTAGDVDITAHRCTLSFGAPAIQLSGALAHELYATMIEAGVQSEGTMGHVHESLKDLRCTIDVAAVKQNGGAGAHCDYAPF
jgi:hypothetical protein